ncbi:hypothetical protein [Mycobacterium sp. E1747]|nr:hypothetical protein [Mycobacterium sp. E1747]
MEPPSPIGQRSLPAEIRWATADAALDATVDQHDVRPSVAPVGHVYR